ncbi:hypothetical protein M5D96_001918 [Drosophila gunungcola]|uniref:Uncharacterized protein n=1 Tax=Drosophila gunungcola TaxID=103775 RepID=A0A9P9YZU7_9MUSC|nr:hypothetical protein M5D96_001918 [Drosophila gunungcola]
MNCLRLHRIRRLLGLDLRLNSRSTKWVNDHASSGIEFVPPFDHPPAPYHLN